MKRTPQTVLLQIEFTPAMGMIGTLAINALVYGLLLVGMAMSQLILVKNASISTCMMRTRILK